MLRNIPHPALHRIDDSEKILDEIKSCYNNLQAKYTAAENQEYTLRCIELKLAGKFVKSISFQENLNLNNVLKGVFQNRNILSVQIFDIYEKELIGFKKTDKGLTPIGEARTNNLVIQHKIYQIKDNDLLIGKIIIGYTMYELESIENGFKEELNTLKNSSQAQAKEYFIKLFGMNLILSFIQILSTSIILVFLLNRLIIRPIKTMSFSANNFVVGHDAELPQINSNDEIGKLNISLRLMVTRIKNHINVIEETSKELAQNLAIVQTVQSIAHDVKKPFITMKMILDRLEKFDNIKDSKQFIKRYASWLNSNISMVESLISDLLTLGGSDKIHKEDSNISLIVEKTIQNTFCDQKKTS